MQKSKKYFLISLFSFALFLLLILLLKVVDVKETGVSDTTIGLSTVNFFFRDLIGEHLFFYSFTNWMGISGPAVCLCFAVVGLVELIKRKSIKKVDKEILFLGGLYAICIVLYFLFEIIAVNYRPFLLTDKIEPSFPSSHTFVTCTVMITAIPLINKYFENKKTVRKVLTVLSVFLMVCTEVGRIISGVHWITDIFGGLLLSVALIFLYFGILEAIK